MEDEILVNMYLNLLSESDRLVLYATLGKVMRKKNSDFCNPFIIESARIILENNGVKPGVTGGGKNDNKRTKQKLI